MITIGCKSLATLCKDYEFVVNDKNQLAELIAMLVMGWSRHIAGATYTDQQIADTMRQCLSDTGYQLDPHGACGYQALKDGLTEGEIGFFLETAHPAKFKQVVDDICHTDVEIPARLAAFMQGEKQSVEMPNDFQAFKQFLLAQ